jgi:hypothetical protein
MLIDVGSHRPPGPWDPDEMRTWIDTTYYWVMMPLLLLMGACIALVYFFG